MSLSKKELEDFWNNLFVSYLHKRVEVEFRVPVTMNGQKTGWGYLSVQGIVTNIRKNEIEVSTGLNDPTILIKRDSISGVKLIEKTKV